MTQGHDSAEDGEAGGRTPTLGPYRLVRPLGVGGMGRVYEAITAEGQPVALKILRTQGLTPDRLRNRVRRLEREARALRAIRHPNVVAFHDAGVIAGHPYLAMELVRGPDLLSILRRGKPLPYPLAERLLFQLCAAVAAVHAAGIVHRDLKPGNVILHGAERTVKLTDFGIARRHEEADLAPDDDEEESPAVDEPTWSITGHAAQQPGTPYYMAPEQVRGEALHMHSDIWGLGVVLYELVCGERPFVGDSLAAIKAAVCDGCPPPLPEAVPAHVRSVVYRCLLKPVSWRFASATALMEALHERRIEQLAPVGADGPTPLELAGCPYCGSALVDGAGRCSTCSHRLEPFRSGWLLGHHLDGRSLVGCGACGAATTTGQRECHRCGRQLVLPPIRAAGETRAAGAARTRGAGTLRACPHCNRTIDVAREQCPACGINVAAVDAGRIVFEADADEPLRCGQCDAPIHDAGIGLCAHCGLNFVSGKLPGGKAWVE